MFGKTMFSKGFDDSYYRGHKINLRPKENNYEVNKLEKESKE